MNIKLHKHTRLCKLIQYAYIYICMYEKNHTWMHEHHVNLNMHTPAQTFIYAHMYTCTNFHTCTHLHKLSYVHTPAQTFIHAHTHTCTCVNTNTHHMHACRRAPTHTHTHTHTHKHTHTFLDLLEAIHSIKYHDRRSLMMNPGPVTNCRENS